MAFNFSFRTWTVPHWLAVAGGTVVGAVAGALEHYLTTIPAAELVQDIMTVKGLEALGQGALAVGIPALISSIALVAKQMQSPAAQAEANALAKGQVK